ncbi:MAG: XTP/dITP diphosphatase [Desulfatibacillaceae bacterium]
MKQVLVLATRNQGKTREMRELLADYPVEIRNLDDFGPIPEVEEDGDTFEENAYKKASHTARVLGFPALADDSGLSVEALDGRPGVHSARYGGEGLSDADRCEKLLEEMDNVEDRRAAFVCFLSLAVPSGQALTYEARCEGEITREMRGEGGFGYDPVFFSPDKGRTFAELSSAEKSEVSHRGKALRELGGEFDKVLKWIEMHRPVFVKTPCQE